MNRLAAPLHVAIFKEAGLDECDPPDGGAIAVAERLFGDDAIVLVDDGPEACWALCSDGARRIAVRRDATPQRANYGVALAIANAAIGRERRLDGMPQPQRGALARMLAAFIVAPPAYVQSLLEEGLDAEAIADACCITMTCAALRIAEERAASIIVTTPRTIYRRGDLLRWVSDDDVRSLARRPGLRSVHRTVFRDEPDHVALTRAS